jgi:hypothetical protein
MYDRAFESDSSGLHVKGAAIKISLAFIECNLFSKVSIISPQNAKSMQRRAQYYPSQMKLSRHPQPNIYIFVVIFPAY